MITSKRESVFEKDRKRHRDVREGERKKCVREIKRERVRQNRSNSVEIIKCALLIA